MTWVKKGGIVNEWGRKSMLVIFRAFIIFRKDNHLHAELVPDNILIWPVKGGIHKQATPHGRGGGHEHSHSPAQGNNIWTSLPDCVCNSGIAPNYHDYHGNFTAELFERLFDRMCLALRNRYGPCHIHMDGAKYHVQKVNPPPTIASRVTDINAWFEQEGIP